MAAMTLLLAWVPFLHAWPTEIAPSVRLAMFLPLALCVAAVYRATRARTAQDLLLPTLRTFASVVIGMAAIAVGFYLVYELVIHYW